MEGLNSYNNRKRILVFIIVLGVSFFSFVFAQTVSSNLPAGVTQAQIAPALEDLSKAYGKTVTSVTDAGTICNSEQFLATCAEIGKRYNLYSKEDVKQVDILLTEIKGDIGTRLSQCTTAECLLNVSKQLAEKVVAKNPQLATQLDLTPKKVEEKRAVVDAAKEAGVDLQVCRNMDPDSASVDLLRACARLAKDSRVEKVLSKETKSGTNSLDSTLALRESLTSGEFSCGDKTPAGCGNFCLNVTAEARTKGVASIPPVCRQIAEKFFGAEGLKHLEAAYTNVDQASDYYAKKAQNSVFATQDGTTLTDPAEIGRYLEEQGRLGNVAGVSKGLDFMVANGFIQPDEKEYALKMVQSFKEKGGLPTGFDACRKDPKSCADFVPKEFRGQLESANKANQIISQELGFNPADCGEKAVSDASVRSRCLEAAQRVISRLETGSTQSADTQKIVTDIKEQTRQNAALDKFNNTAHEQSGPGGCTNARDCAAYCSDPTRGAECLSYGAKLQIFQGKDIIQRYQDYSDRLQAPQFSNQVNFSAVGPFPGFQPPSQGTFTPPGQVPGFTTPGPGFSAPPPFTTTGPQQGFGPAGYGGPSPECLRSIQSGDFARAKEICYTPQVPVAQTNLLPTPDQNQNPAQAPFTNRQEVCPALPTVSSCPPGQRMQVVFSSPTCGTFNTCVADFVVPPGPLPKPPPFITPPAPGPYPSSSTPPYNSDPATACAQAGGTWNASTNYCQMSNNSTACPSGWYWNGSSCVSSSTTTCPAGQYWNGSTCMITPGGTCPSGQYWNGTACTSTGSTCPSGQYWSGSACVVNPSGGTTCPTGQYWYMPQGSTVGSCTFSPGGICPTGQYWYMPQGSTVGSCKSGTASSTAACPSGQYWNGSICMTSSPGACQAGQYWYTPPGSTVGSCVPTAVTSTSSTTCTSGQYWNGSACVSSTTTTCPTGQYWNGTACTINTSPSAACTQAGGTWNSSTNYCQMPTCPSGQYWYTPSGSTVGSCTTTASSTTTACPSGWYWSGTSCVSSTTTTCPTGQYWSGSACVVNPSGGTTCPTGQYWYTPPGSTVGSCVSTTPVTTCATGQYWNGTACVSSTTTTTCPTGQYWSGSACVVNPSGGTTCPTGQYWYTPPGSTVGSCVSTTPVTTCATGQYWNGTACVNSTTTTCPTGQYWNGTACTINTSPSAACTQAGGTWNSSTNYCQMPNSTTCPSPSWWDPSINACHPASLNVNLLLGQIISSLNNLSHLLNVNP